MADPTPGDLRARLRILANDYPVGSIHHNTVEQAIAALSALPAAGGLAPVLTAYRCDYCGRDYYDTANCCESRREYLAASTTPQPSAAEGECSGYCCPGCGRCYQCHKQALECATTTPDAAVGAQGDGFRAALEQIAAETSANNATEAADRFQRIARDALAAPAAGKGVDADKFMAAFNCEAENTTGTRIYCADRQNVVTALAAALTRQPVAGDGIRNGYRHVVHELLTNIKRAAIRGRCGKLDDSNFIATCDHVENLADEALSYIAPAATPTDGGEGKS